MMQRLAAEIARFEKRPLRVRVAKALYDQLELEMRNMALYPAEKPVRQLTICGVPVEIDDERSLGAYDLDWS